MGAQFLSTCYETTAEAEAEYYQSQSQQWQVDGSPVVVKHYWNGSAWRIHRVDYNTSGVRSVGWDQAAEVVQFPYCAQSETTAQFTDGVLLGWGVVTCMAIAWGFRAMRREAERM